MFTSPHSAPITQVTSRTILTFVVLVIIALAIWGLRRAWLGKAAEFAALPAPATAVPTNATALTPAYPARFAGTTVTGQWLRRVTVHSLGTPRGISVSVYREGIYLTDDADFKLWLSCDHITGIRTGRGIAGDVVEPDGMVIITWQLGEQLLDTGLRLNRHEDHENFYHTASDLLKVKTRDGEAR